jgi:hypothetical protein
MAWADKVGLGSVATLVAAVSAAIANFTVSLPHWE